MINGEVKFIDSNGLRLWTERFGHSGDPVVLLIIGTSAQGIGWPDELVHTLVRGGRQVIRYDHRDTGQSDVVDFERHPYTLTDLTADVLAVLDGQHVPAAHIVGASLGGTIAQLLAVHHPDRVATLTAMMTGPMGHSSGPAWARALAGQAPDPSDLPPPAPEFLHHLMKLASSPPATPGERQAADLQTWRILSGPVLPFDEQAASQHIELSYRRAKDPVAALHHDAAGRVMTPDRQAPLAEVTAPAQVIHGTADPLRPLAHGQALAAQLPAARFHPILGMGHAFFSPGLPHQLAELILAHTAAGSPEVT
jgi:pimeloyl-ACP methyl ester carboxylesterase